MSDHVLDHQTHVFSLFHPQLWLNEVDVISPWTIGRYCDESGADDYGEEKIKGDLEAIKKQNEENERVGNPGKKLEYMPVVFPGGSVSQRFM
jgi:hypothetical protein